MIVYSTYCPAHRLMVRCTASIDTSFLAIPSTSPHGFPSLAYRTTKLYPPSYQLETLNATISRPSSPSYTLRELCWISVPTRLLSRLTRLQEFRGKRAVIQTMEISTLPIYPLGLCLSSKTCPKVHPISHTTRSARTCAHLFG